LEGRSTVACPYDGKHELKSDFRESLQAFARPDFQDFFDIVKAGLAGLCTPVDLNISIQ
jgi:hypothetical protein